MKRVYSAADAFLPKENLTISREVLDEETLALRVFRLGKGTSISPEAYEHRALYVGLFGEGKLIDEDGAAVAALSPGSAYVLPAHRMNGVEADSGTSYLEFYLKEDMSMNYLEEGRAVALRELVDYEEDSIVNLDLLDDEAAKLVVMAFDEGTSLSPHKAPAEAYVAILEGEATVTYEGEAHAMVPGDIIRFERGGLHAVEADTTMKMALLLLLA
ncbi:MAG: cupin domain-containing protein [Peptoniphilus sp.]|nr:cupin domain-containing protein [Peptoniphilus sp.]MDY6045182.1 cupin domain-containing protein [Peptoniphilus sp.]